MTVGGNYTLKGFLLQKSVRPKPRLHQPLAWPDATVPYKIGYNYNGRYFLIVFYCALRIIYNITCKLCNFICVANNTALIRKAMDMTEARTCVVLRPKTLDDFDYVYFAAEMG